MTSQSQHEPSPDYTAPADEWAALLTLATASDPARAIAEGGWMREHFPCAADAFAQLEAAHAPVVLSVPEDYSSASASSDLDALRASLGGLAASRTVTAMNREALRRMRAGSDPRELIAAQREALDIAERLAKPRERGTRATLGTLAAGYFDELAQRKEAMPTGLGKLDECLGDGLLPHRLTVLLGEPGSGKTTLANQIAEHIASAGRPVVYLTTEDTPATLLHKTVARLGALDYRAVQRGYENSMPAIRKALAMVAERKSAARLLYLDTFRSIEDLRAVCREHFARFGASQGGGSGLLVVDYLQRVARSMPGSDRELRLAVSNLTDGLRALGRELDCSVLTLASQNRAGYGSSNALASAKESGDIEYGVDVLMALAKPSEERNGKATTPAPMVGLGHEVRYLTIAKNRQGENGQTVTLDWYPARQHFTELAK